MGKQESFVLYFSDKGIFDSLTDEEAGILMRGIFDFKIDGVIPEFESPLVNMGFSVIKGHLERDAKKYDSECAKRRKNAHKKHWLDAFGSKYATKFESDEAFEIWWKQNKDRELSDDEDG